MQSPEEQPTDSHTQPANQSQTQKKQGRAKNKPPKGKARNSDQPQQKVKENETDQKLPFSNYKQRIQKKKEEVQDERMPSYLEATHADIGETHVNSIASRNQGSFLLDVQAIQRAAYNKSDHLTSQFGMSINQNYEGQSQIRNAIASITLVAIGVQIIHADTESAFDKSPLKDLLREKIYIPPILADYITLFGDFALKTGRIVVKEKVQTVKRLLAEAILSIRELPAVFQDHLKISSPFDRQLDLERGEYGCFYPQPDLRTQVRAHLVDLYNTQSEQNKRQPGINPSAGLVPPDVGHENQLRASGYQPPLGMFRNIQHAYDDIDWIMDHQQALQRVELNLSTSNTTVEFFVRHGQQILRSAVKLVSLLTNRVHFAEVKFKDQGSRFQYCVMHDLNVFESQIMMTKEDIAMQGKFRVTHSITFERSLRATGSCTPPEIRKSVWKNVMKQK